MINNWQEFNITTNFQGESVEVSGSWSEGHGGYVSTINNVLGEPPEPSEIEIDDVQFEGVSIYPFLSSDYLDDIEEIVSRELEN